MARAKLYHIRRIQRRCMCHVQGMQLTPGNLFGPGSPSYSRRVSKNPGRYRTHLPCKCRVLSRGLLHRLCIRFRRLHRDNPSHIRSALQQPRWACKFLCHCRLGRPGLVRRSPSTVSQKGRPNRRRTRMYQLVRTPYRHTNIHHGQSRHLPHLHRRSLCN